MLVRIYRTYYMFVLSNNPEHSLRRVMSYNSPAKIKARDVSLRLIFTSIVAVELTFVLIMLFGFSPEVVKDCCGSCDRGLVFRECLFSDEFGFAVTLVNAVPSFLGLYWVSRIFHVRRIVLRKGGSVSEQTASLIQKAINKQLKLLSPVLYVAMLIIIVGASLVCLNYTPWPTSSSKARQKYYLIRCFAFLFVTMTSLALMFKPVVQDLLKEVNGKEDPSTTNPLSPSARRDIYKAKKMGGIPAWMLGTAGGTDTTTREGTTAMTSTAVETKVAAKEKTSSTPEEASPLGLDTSDKDDLNHPAPGSRSPDASVAEHLAVQDALPEVKEEVEPPINIARGLPEALESALAPSDRVETEQAFEAVTPSMDAPVSETPEANFENEGVGTHDNVAGDFLATTLEKTSLQTSLGSETEPTYDSNADGTTSPQSSFPTKDTKGREEENVPRVLENTDKAPTEQIEDELPECVLQKESTSEEESSQQADASLPSGKDDLHTDVSLLNGADNEHTMMSLPVEVDLHLDENIPVFQNGPLNENLPSKINDVGDPGSTQTENQDVSSAVIEAQNPVPSPTMEASTAAETLPRVQNLENTTSGSST
eukprot:CAMPEP_0184545454 /NCGR_PEP_ID=MMETSP0199_2-20130426/4315_1 /TAXON_ID=1112570 /ORGANISM="Thraustochytrium sp., Strain LLF1b" /LENGTH=594 /DNA_ID=CAMNT_0026939753 /DNA_START=740 /DNA_END=2524 /DNA_ORIENTATION=+